MTSVAVLRLTLAVGIIVLFLGSLQGTGETIVVDDDDTDLKWSDFNTIQEGIDNASTGDTVRVYEGTYDENVDINTSIYLRGNGSHESYVRGDGTDNVIEIRMKNVTVSHFSITGGGNDTNMAGISIVDADNSKIGFCRIYNNSREGVSMFFVNNTRVKHSSIRENGNRGIYMNTCHNSTILNCRIEDNDHIGLVQVRTDNALIRDNHVERNGGHGIELGSECDGSLIYRNYFHNNVNSSQGFDSTGNNTWDNGVDAGNYWDDYNGSDGDGDGIGDTPYEIDGPGNATDRYPLMEPNETQVWIVDDEEGDWMHFRWIQNAIQNSTDGDIIRVYDGNFFGYHNINRELSLIGNGTDETIVDAYGNWSCFDVNADNVTIDGFFINGTNPFVWEDDDPGIDNHGHDNLLVGNCTIEAGHHGIWLSWTNNTQIWNTRIWNATWSSWSWGVFAEGNISNFIGKNIQVSDSENGFYISVHENVRVRNCSIFDIHHDGMELDDYRSGELSAITVSDCEFHDMSRGIYVRKDRARIDNCSFTSILETGIEARQPGNIISNCTFNEVGNVGIIVNSDRTTIDNCTVGDTNRSSISFLTSQGNMLKYSTLSRGLYVSSNILDNYNHTVISTTVQGLPLEYLFEESDISLTGNIGQVYIAGSSNISVDSLKVENVVIGFVSFSSDWVNISRSTILNTSYSGFELRLSNNVTIQDSTILGDPDHQYSSGAIIQSCDNTTLANISVSDYRYDGLNVQSTSFFEINNGTISQSGDGLYFNLCPDFIVTDTNIENSSISSIAVHHSPRGTVMNLSCYHDTRSSIYLYRSSSFYAESCQLYRGLYVSNNNVSRYSSHKIIDTTSMGLPIIYLVNGSNETYTNIGQIFLVNSTDINVRDVNVTGICTFGMIRDSNRIDLNDVNIKHYPFTGFMVYTSSNIRINNTSLSNEILAMGSGLAEIYIWKCDNVSIENTSASGSNDNGLHLYDCDDVNILRSTFEYNDGTGIFVEARGWDGSMSENVWIDHCTAGNNIHGIHLKNTNSTTISNCTLINNSYYGIYLYYADWNFLDDNTAENNSHGIDIAFSNNNVITGNDLLGNLGYGIYIFYQSDENEIHHNSFVNNSNTPQAYDRYTDNHWDDGSEGNFWSDYNGTDDDGDGIGETPYYIDGPGNATDRYPLVEKGNYTGPIWYVDDDNVNDTEMDGSESHPFDTILKAMENASANHTIHVWAGTYLENVTINHTGLSLLGNGSAGTTISGEGSGDVVWLIANNINIEGFRITSSGGAAGDAAIDTNSMMNITIREVVVAASEYGIFIDNSVDIDIINSTAEDCSFGVRSESSQWVNITNIDAIMNTNTGIWMLNTDNVTITGGTIQENTNDGIHLEDVPGAYISGVTIEDQGDDGMEISDSGQTMVHGVVIINATFGIFSSQSSHVSVISTSISEVSNDAIAFTLLSDNFLLEGCTISDSGWGVNVDSTIDGRMGNTTIGSSGTSDISLTSASTATTYNVTFGNVTCDFTSMLTVKNYLRLRVVNQYDEPWNGADVNITDNDESIYASSGYNGTDPKTTKNGYISWVLVTDRIYDGSSTATENETIAYAMAEGNEGNLTINMSTTHIEDLVVNLSEEGILYVDDDNAGDPDMDGSRVHPFDTVEKAVDNSTDGSTIRVWDGHYIENINVSKWLHFLGNGSETIIDGDGLRIFDVNSDNVTFESLNVTNSGGNVGIYFNGYDGLNIIDCQLYDHDWAVMLYNTNGSMVMGSNFTQAVYSVYQFGSTNVTFMDLTLIDVDTGLYIESSNMITIRNISSESDSTGIFLYRSENATINESSIDGFGDGIIVSQSEGVSISDCTITTSDTGIWFNYVNGTDIADVDITDTRSGILFYNSKWMNVSNSVVHTQERGIDAFYGSELYLDTVHMNSTERGILLLNFEGATMRSVSISGTDQGFGVDGREFAHFVHDIDTSNFVNGLEVQYRVSEPGKVALNGSFGFVGLVDTDATLDIDVHNSWQGVMIAFCDDVSVTGNLRDNFVGIYALNASSLAVEDVAMDSTDYGFVLQSSSWINVSDVEGSSMTNASWISYSHNLSFVRTDLECSSGGFKLMNSTDIDFTNVSISSSLDFDIVGSSVTVLNSTFRASSISNDDGLLTVMNFLHIHVNNTNGQDYQGADVRIVDDNKTIYASAGYGGSDPQTDSEGYVRWILVTDRIYNGSATADENTTTVDVKTPQWNEQRDVNMSTTHTEWFDEVEPPNKRPWVEILDPQDGASITRTGGRRIYGNSSDDDGEVIEVRIRFDDETTWQLCTGTFDWQYDWDTHSYDEGQHEIHARSTDNEDDHSDVFTIIVYLVDNKPPNCSISSPEPGVYVDGTVTISGNADDPEGDMDEVEVAIVPEGQSPSSGDWVQAQDTSDNGTWYSWEFEWDTLEPNRTDDGVYDVYARSRDGENLTRTVTINLSLDNPDIPTVSIREPKKDDELSGTVTINGTAKDPDHDGEVTNVYVAFTERGEEPSGSDWQEAEDTSGTKDPYWSWEFEWDTTGLDDGNYTIHAMSLDGGNASERLSRNVSIDNVNTIPETVLTYPGEGDRLSGDVEVSGYVIDPDDPLDSVDVTIMWVEDGELLNQYTLYVSYHKVAWNRWNWSVNWDTSEDEPGNYTVQANATDRREAVSNESVVNVTVWKNVPPMLEFTNPDGVDDTVWKGEQSWFFIQWDDDDPEENATIKLYYDDDDSGFDGTKLHSGQLYEDTEDKNGQEKDSYRWDVTDIPEGDYWLYAVLEDFVNDEPTKVYADHVLPIREGSPNVPPSVEIDQPDGIDDMIDAGDEYTIFFNASDDDGDEISIQIFYDTDDVRSNGGYTNITEGTISDSRREFTWDTSGVEKGSYFILFLLDDQENEEWVYSDGPITIGDVIPPASVGSAKARDLGFGDALNLTWTAPGDDENEGRATAYLIRYDNEDITTEGRWDLAVEVDNELVPGEPGVEEWFHVTVPDNATYYFAVRAVDDEGNLGPIVTITNTTTLKTNEYEFTLIGGYSGVLEWIGFADVFAMEGDSDDDAPAGLISLDKYVEVLHYGGEYRDLRMEITYPSTLDGTNGLENAKVYHRIGTSGWVVVEDSGIDTGERVIHAELGDLSLFGIFIPVSDPPRLRSLVYEPTFPTEDDDVTFTVVFIYELDELPVDVFLFVDEERYDMELANGTPLEGAYYKVKVGLSKGEYDIVVRAYGDPTSGSFDEISSVETSIEVGEGEEDDEFPFAIVGGVIAAVVIVLLLVIVDRKRRRARAAEAMKEPTTTAPVDVIEAEVYEETVEFEAPPSFSESAGEEIETTGVAEAGETVAETVPTGEAAEPVQEGGVPTEVPEPAPVPVVPPPRLELPKVPGAPPEGKAKKRKEPKAIETEVMDIGKIMVAPCPSCGHNLIIPKERPVDIKCPGCEDEFTIE